MKTLTAFALLSLVSVSSHAELKDWYDKDVWQP